MRETLKYIRVLNWGYGGFTPITLSKDFERSLQQAQEILKQLESLNEDALFVEAKSANGKANLNDFVKVNADIDHQLHFMRDRKDLLEMLKPDYWEKDKPEPVKNPKRLFRWAFDEIDKYEKDCVWTFEQWREYKWTLSEIEKGFEDRLRQFAAAYDYSLVGNDPNQEPQQIAKELKTDEAKRVFNKALGKGLIKVDENKYKWVDSASLYGYFVDKTSDFLNIRHSNNRIPWKKYGTIITNHLEILATAKQAVNDYHNKELSPPEGDDIVDSICK